MAAVIEEEGKKIREAVKWISDMCLQHPEKKRSSFIFLIEDYSKSSCV